MISKKETDIVCIGDTTTDAFIKLKDAHVHCRIKERDCEISFPFGEKIPFESVKIIHGAGNAANVATTTSRLGLHTALITDIGDDENGLECLQSFRKEEIITKHVKIHNGKATNYHFVLWYNSERTILVNHVEYEYSLPKNLKAPKWIYLTSLADGSEGYMDQIADYLETNDHVRLAFQPGTFQLKMGARALSRIYSLANVLIVNFTEAQRLLETKSGGVKNLLFKLKELGPQLVVITDGTKGSYMFDGEHYYHIPSYADPKPAIERTGCGDAWAGTFVSALALGLSPLEALVWAPVNPMSVAQYVGSKEGLLTRKQLEWWLKNAPEDYRPREI